MLEKLAGIFKRDRREFEAFQIEVSTYCSLECQLCPRTFFAEQWIFQQMSMETFQKIASHFDRTEWVSFHGWGEPLENENILPMLHQAKQANCLTSLTTNGLHLTEDLSHQLLTQDLDLILISFEGAMKGVQENFGIGADFQRILDRAEGLVRLKRKLGRKTPIVKFSFPMTRLNVLELPGLVPLASKLGVDEFLFTHLDYLPSERYNLLRTFSHQSPAPAFQESIDEIHRTGKKERMAVNTPPLKAEEIPVCQANPPHRVFFSADGSVAPCLYRLIPIKGDIPRIFMHKEYRVPQTFFGNVKNENFPAIWEKDTYKKFREIFEERRKAQSDTVQMLDLFTNIRSSGITKEAPKELPPLPRICRTCYKAYGV